MVLAKGRAAHGRHAVIRAMGRRDDGVCRWTVSASRRVGSAVKRNRAKRRLRAVAREAELPPGSDLVIIARASAATCEFSDLVKDVEALITEVAGHQGAEVTR